jgi:hypothetical protein
MLVFRMELEKQLLDVFSSKLKFRVHLSKFDKALIIINSRDIMSGG